MWRDTARNSIYKAKGGLRRDQPCWRLDSASLLNFEKTHFCHLSHLVCVTSLWHQIMSKLISGPLDFKLPIVKTLVGKFCELQHRQPVPCTPVLFFCYNVGSSEEYKVHDTCLSATLPQQSVLAMDALRTMTSPHLPSSSRSRWDTWFSTGNANFCNESISVTTYNGE